MSEEFKVECLVKCIFKYVLSNDELKIIKKTLINNKIKLLTQKHIKIHGINDFYKKKKRHLELNSWLNSYLNISLKK